MLDDLLTLDSLVKREEERKLRLAGKKPIPRELQDAVTETRKAIKDAFGGRALTAPKFKLTKSA